MKIIWTIPALNGVNKAIDFTEVNFPNNKNKLIELIKKTQEQTGRKWVVYNPYYH